LTAKHFLACLILGGLLINNIFTLKKFISILKLFFDVFIKSIIITFFISFILFILIDYSPGAAGFLKQPFLHWYAKMLMFDLDSAKNYGPPIASYIYSDLWFSFKYIFLSVMFALTIAIIFLYYRKSVFINNCLIQPVLSFSFIHLIFFYWLIKELPYIHSDFLLIIALSIGSGVFYDYYSLLAKEHENIMNKDYSLFAAYSGYNVYKFARKDLLSNLAVITLSRLPILFSGMIIVEIFTRGKEPSYSGIGFRIWDSLKYNNFEIALTATALSIFILTFIYLLIEKIKLKNR